MLLIKKYAVKKIKNYGLRQLNLLVSFDTSRGLEYHHSPRAAQSYNACIRSCRANA